MKFESIAVRRFREAEIAPLVPILTANGQYDFPEVEGPEAMRRVGLCSAAVFLCAEIDNKVAGCIRAPYDGARAIITYSALIHNFKIRISAHPGTCCLHGTRTPRCTHGRRAYYRRLTVLLGRLRL